MSSGIYLKLGTNLYFIDNQHQLHSVETGIVESKNYIPAKDKLITISATTIEIYQGTQKTILPNTISGPLSYVYHYSHTKDVLFITNGTSKLYAVKNNQLFESETNMIYPVNSFSECLNLKNKIYCSDYNQNQGYLIDDNLSIEVIHFAQKQKIVDTGNGKIYFQELVSGKILYYENGEFFDLGVSLGSIKTIVKSDKFFSSTDPDFLAFYLTEDASPKINFHYYEINAKTNELKLVEEFSVDQSDPSWESQYYRELLRLLGKIYPSGRLVSSLASP